MKENRPKRGRIRYVLKEDKDIEEVALAVPSIIFSIEKLNREISEKEDEFRSAQKRLNSQREDLKTLLKKRSQFVEVLTKLKTIKSKRTKNMPKNGNPSEFVSLNNPLIEIYTQEDMDKLEQEEREEEIEEKEREKREKEQEKARLKRVRMNAYP